MHEQSTSGPAAHVSTRLVDAAMVVAFTLAAVAAGWPQHSGHGLATVPLVALPLAGRHRWPLTCFALLLLGVGLTGPLSAAPAVLMLALGIGGYSAVGVTGRWPRIMAGAGTVSVLLLMHFSRTSGSSAVLPVAAWLLALAVRLLWLRAQTAEQHAEALRREHRAQQALAVETERARIARELHDVLGHNVSVMMIQAGAARHAVQGQPEVSQALLEVEAAGRQAMSELRHLLRLLGPDGSDSERDGLSPQPGLEHLDPLVDRICAAGLPVNLTVLGRVRSLEPGLDLAAYRVVQEGLTNALKYAGGAPTEVAVAYEPTGLSVTVRDRGGSGGHEARDGSGRGLLGLRERVALYHGQFQAGRLDDGGYQIHAYFPAEAS